MSAAACNMKMLNLELGGKSPFVVFNDANIERAVGTGGLMSTLSAGQFCASPTRFIVQDKVYDEFCEKLTEYYKSIKVGEFSEENVGMGP